MLENIERYKSEIDEINEEMSELDIRRSKLYRKLYNEIVDNSNSFEELFSNIEKTQINYSRINSILEIFKNRIQKENKILVFKGCSLTKTNDGLFKSSIKTIEITKDIEYIKLDITTYKTKILEIGFYTDGVYRRRISPSDVLLFDNMEAAKLYLEVGDD